MTRRERLTAKAEKRREWSEKARARGNATITTASTMASGIPLGQPILVGHHSERRDRRYRARISAKFDRGCEQLAKAEHHASAADGLERQLDRSIFSDDPDAIDALAAKVAELEREREAIKDLNRRCRAGDPAAIAEASRTCRHTADDPRKGLPSYKLTNLGAEIRRTKQRIEEVRTRQARAAKAETAGVLFEGDGDYCRITFPEKPDREVLAALRAAGFRWGAGSWVGRRAALPAEVAELVAAGEEVGRGA